MDIHISVRNLVEFILRSGDIDNRKAVAPENAMQEGSRIHRMIQRRMGSDYHAEVSLQYLYETENYRILIDGRADGIIDATESNGKDRLYTMKSKPKSDKTERKYRLLNINKFYRICPQYFTSKGLLKFKTCGRIYTKAVFKP